MIESIPPMPIHPDGQQLDKLLKDGLLIYFPMALPLSNGHLSLDHGALIELLSHHQNLLIIQDLDGVCMGLVKDPLTRHISPDYLHAISVFEDHFFVLTNGEHIGDRGVNPIIDRAVSSLSSKPSMRYLPGLGAGGVQWQDTDGKVSHPGVREEVLHFLSQIPVTMEQHIRHFFATQAEHLDAVCLDTCLQAAILNNQVSPTVNLNVFYDQLSDRPNVYQALQQAIAQLTGSLLENAKQKGLADDFFVHYAPNRGQDKDGNEIIELSRAGDSGTTDFQFMLKGARKEVGLLFLLNQYYGKHTGCFPLGEDFHVLSAPHSHTELLAVVRDNFDPAAMPLIIGVGDTVTSKGERINGTLQFFRGGSDRGFLQLIQMIGEAYNIPNLTVYVDSSAGEVKNRQSIKVESHNGQCAVVQGPTDERDREDPLRLNIVIPGGHQAYIDIIQQAATERIKMD